jgi:hypothetical protein
MKFWFAIELVGFKEADTIHKMGKRAKAIKMIATIHRPILP